MCDCRLVFWRKKTTLKRNVPVVDICLQDYMCICMPTCLMCCSCTYAYLDRLLVFICTCIYTHVSCRTCIIHIRTYIYAGSFSMLDYDNVCKKTALKKFSKENEKASWLNKWDKKAAHAFAIYMKLSSNETKRLHMHAQYTWYCHQERHMHAHILIPVWQSGWLVSTRCQNHIFP